MEKNFGEWLKQFRAERKLWRNDFAAAVGFGQSLVSKIERGDQLPTADFCIEIARVYSMPLEYVLFVAGRLTESEYAEQQRLKAAPQNNPTLQNIGNSLDAITSASGIEEAERLVEELEALIRVYEQRAKTRRRKG